MLPVLFGLAVALPCWKRRAWMLPVVCLGLVTTLSGATFLAVALGLGLVCAARGQKTFLGFAAVFLLCTVLLPPVLPRPNADILHESVALYGPEGRVTKRYPEWQAAAEMTRENPWLGVGIGNYQKNVGQYYGTIPSPAEKLESDTQNLYLVLASTTGLPGLFCFVGMLALFAARAARGVVTAHSPFASALALGLLAGLVAFAVNALWSPLLVRGIGIPLAVNCALASALAAAPRGHRTKNNGTEGNEENEG
jgi:O-antigen ligase